MKENSVTEWVSFPAKEHPRKTVLTSFFIISLTVALYYFYGPLYGIICLLVLGFSLLPYFTPTRYRFSENGIAVKKPFYTINKEWKDYRSYYPDRNGVLLSPFPVPSRLENFRGLYIRFSSNRDRVLSYVESRMKKKHEEED